MGFFLLIGSRSSKTEGRFGAPDVCAWGHADGAKCAVQASAASPDELACCADRPMSAALESRMISLLYKCHPAVVAILDARARVSYGQSSGFFASRTDQLTNAGAMMTKVELKAYREQLLDMHKRLNGDVSHLTNEALGTASGVGGNLSNMPIHMADLGSDNFEQENTLNLLANEQQRLDEIMDALERIKQGTFGKCEECEEEIPKARLKEVPYARYCVACARKLEQRSR
jgi:RNA polymerase-binding transcription factor DksA